MVIPVRPLVVFGGCALDWAKRWQPRSRARIWDDELTASALTRAGSAAAMGRDTGYQQGNTKLRTVVMYEQADAPAG